MLSERALKEYRRLLGATGSDVPEAEARQQAEDLMELYRRINKRKAQRQIVETKQKDKTND